MIDLHCHSYFSDGLLAPQDLLLNAVNNGVKTIALTDHDTLDGVEEFINAAANHPSITVIKGIELSTRWKKYDIHILGLDVSLDNDYLCELITQQNLLRIARAHEISQLLQTIGVVDAYAKACAVAGHLRVGRPHFAKVLIQEGIVADFKTAFKQFLSAGRVAYVATKWVNLENVIAAINHAGGKAVIAHPLKYGLTRTKLHELINTFKELGGVGLEVVSGEMNKTQILEAAGLSVRFKLLASTGSDYHGPKISRIGIGQQAQLPLNCEPIF